MRAMMRMTLHKTSLLALPHLCVLLISRALSTIGSKYKPISISSVPLEPHGHLHPPEPPLLVMYSHALMRFVLHNSRLQTPNNSNCSKCRIALLILNLYTAAQLQNWRLYANPRKSLYFWNEHAFRCMTCVASPDRLH